MLLETNDLLILSLEIMEKRVRDKESLRIEGKIILKKSEKISLRGFYRIINSIRRCCVNSLLDTNISFHNV